MPTKTIADIPLTGRTVLMRVDFNVPTKNGEVTNDRRITQALPSVTFTLERGARLILMSHLGRPQGTGFEAAYSMKPVAARLSQLLAQPVSLGPHTVVDPQLDRWVADLQNGEIGLLENLRFHAGETMPDQAKKNPDKALTHDQQKVHTDFVARLATPGEVYVNDAFGTCHRKHASMYGVAQAIRAKGGPAVAGFLVQKEIQYLDEALATPNRPYLVLLGGAKVSDKINLICHLLQKADRILVGGAMAYTLLQAMGIGVGQSLVEHDKIGEMQQLLAMAGDKILLPRDHLATDSFDPKTMTVGRLQEISSRDIPNGLLGMDIGPQTIRAYAEAVASAKTIVWNGPMGVFELPPFATGTKAMARAIAEATQSGATSIVGGGDSAAAAEQTGFDRQISHISTGGGASLVYLEGKPLPALGVLETEP